MLWRDRTGLCAGLVACTVFAGAVLGGCATYGNYPKIDGDVAVNDPNVAPLPTLITVALRWVVDRSPSEGAYVVNLPRGTERKRAESIAGEVGEGAHVVSADSAGLGVFHVSRIWLRGDRAEVDVMRPVGQAHQTVTVRMRSNLGRWVVTSSKIWPVGLGETPELYGWGEGG